jgi:hypothetical protein
MLDEESQDLKDALKKKKNKKKKAGKRKGG